MCLEFPLPVTPEDTNHYVDLLSGQPHNQEALAKARRLSDERRTSLPSPGLPKGGGGRAALPGHPE